MQAGMKFSRQSRRLSLGGGRRETERVSKGHRSWRDSGLAAGLKGGCSGASQRPALGPPALECCSGRLAPFPFGHARQVSRATSGGTSAPDTGEAYLPPEGFRAPQNLVFEVRGGSATPPPSYLLPAPRTAAALPGVVSHPRIRHPPPPAPQGIHISQVGRRHRPGSGAFPSPEFCPHLTEKK